MDSATNERQTLTSELVQTVENVKEIAAQVQQIAMALGLSPAFHTELEAAEVESAVKELSAVSSPHDNPNLEHRTVQTLVNTVRRNTRHIAVLLTTIKQGL